MYFNIAHSQNQKKKYFFYQVVVTTFLHEYFAIIKVIILLVENKNWRIFLHIFPFYAVHVYRNA